MFDDRTSKIEAKVTAENMPKLKHLLRLWKFVFSSAKTMSLIYLGLIILLSLLRPLAALLWGKYIDQVTAYLPGGEIIPLISFVACYYLINLVSGILWRYTAGYEDIERVDLVQAHRFQEMVNAKVLKKLATIDPEYWEVPKINDTSDRVFRFLSDPWEGMNQGVMVQGYLIIAKAVSVISIAATLYLFHPWLCIIVLVAPIPSFYTLMISEKLRFKFVKENSKRLRRANYFQDVLLRHGAKEVRTMGLFDFFYAKWKTEMDDYTAKEKILYRNQTWIDMSNDLVTTGANIGANLLTISMMAAGHITLGALGSCMSLIATLLADTNELIRSITKFLTKKNESALFYDILDLKERPGDLMCHGVNQMATKELKYRYPLSESYVLNGVDFLVSKGEKIAFVGENGAGKTTFVKLLVGILSASDGEFTINQDSAESISLESRFGNICSVSQNPARYHTFTTADNIFLGDTEHHRDESRIQEAARFAGFDDVSLDMMLGKEIGGSDLSGGQWQKLAIARAVYRNRNFIILDEPTSNLDPLAETEIFEKYMALAKEKTVIFVTHRISVAALAERIVVFDHGKIVEEGSHHELLQRKGTYAALYHEQAKWYNR